MFEYLNIELTTRCNKSCHFCGRAAARKAGTLELGDMDIKLFEHILSQYHGAIIQFHRDGEPLLYPYLWKVGYMCRSSSKVTNIVTNGILLYERRQEVMEFDTVCVSVIEDDSQQFEQVKRFVEAVNMPVIIKFLGDYYNPEFEKLGLKTTRRAIHQPLADNQYQRPSVIPELGICLDFLMKPSINWKGQFSICNRYDSSGHGIIGDCTKQSIKSIWHSEKRIEYLAWHRQGRRENIPMCKNCEFYGVPVA